MKIKLDPFEVMFLMTAYLALKTRDPMLKEATKTMLKDFNKK